MANTNKIEKAAVRAVEEHFPGRKIGNRDWLVFNGLGLVYAVWFMNTERRHAIHSVCVVKRKFFSGENDPFKKE